MKETPATPKRDHLKKEIFGVFWCAMGLYFMLALFTFHNGDPSFNNNLHPETVSNVGGTVGAHLADLMYQIFGLPSLLFPVGCFLLAWRLLKFRDVRFRFYRCGAFVLLVISLAGLLALRLRVVLLFGQQIQEAGGGRRATSGRSPRSRIQHHRCSHIPQRLAAGGAHAVGPFFHGSVS